MILYAKTSVFRHIRKAVSGFWLATSLLILSPVPMVHAQSVLPNPGFETSLAVSADNGSIVVAEKSEVKESEERPVTIKTIYMASTAYTSRPQETDADPFVTADGSDVRDGIVATNVLPFGTKIRLPTVFGDRIFEVHDRMNARYSYRVDVWMNDLAAARQYGLKRRIPVEVVAWGDNKTQWVARAERLRALRQAAKHAKEMAWK